MIEFRADFGAEDAVRLAPCKDDKPKDAEIMLFQAGSDCYLSANLYSVFSRHSAQLLPIPQTLWLNLEKNAENRGF